MTIKDYLIAKHGKREFGKLMDRIAAITVPDKEDSRE